MLSEEGGAVIVAVVVEFVVVVVVAVGGGGGVGVGVVVVWPAVIGPSSGCNSSAMTCDSAEDKVTVCAQDKGSGSSRVIQVCDPNRWMCFKIRDAIFLFYFLFSVQWEYRTTRPRNLLGLY